MKIFTIGHSTRNLEEFLDILKNFNIEMVVDVRRWPTSKKFPWFSKDSLQKELNKNNIQYTHYPELGGYRKEGYAHFAKTEEFSDSLTNLIKIIDDKNATIMCAERLFWRCHRKYISNELVKLGYNVLHILDMQKTYEHKIKDLKEKMDLRIWCDKQAKKIRKK